MGDQIKHTKNWKKYLLIGSVGLNLIFAGLIVGAVIKGKPEQRSAAPMGNMRAVMSALPDEKRNELRAIFDQNKSKNKFDRAKFRAAAESISKAVEAVPFNRAALEAAFDQQQNMVSVAAKSGSQAFVEVISNMTDEERMVFSKHMRENHKKSKRKKDK
ncbi:hypothetical protein GCM10008927_20330 [Amylibacter ulvae]|uniref:Zinc resistance-associated protein n=1 Tax=Paramylibacter ulvae TaxID=1651968 RepID=A0ABQ3D4N8_9RHOB|nr:periplasmic heavy metal sensor [Amylibacter ulvae]GHA54467.1 hypothetical protein GCM10008927_20330 [Amylibacter ulvae]